MLQRTCLGLGLLVFAALSCHQPVSLPPVQGPPLTVPEARGGHAGPPVTRALEVTYTSPEGQLTSAHSQITVSFNKPMVALERVESRAAVSPLRLSPEIAGKQRWLGSRTLVFEPERPLPGSTTFVASVGKGLRALDQTTLERDYRWTFTTPRLEVSRSTPYAGAVRQQPDTTVELFFNQPVKPQVLERVASFRTRKSGENEVVVRARVRQGKNPQHLQLRPANALPLDADVTLRVEGELQGTEGPLPLRSPYTLRFRTYGPLRVQRLSCTAECDPEEGVEVLLTNPVELGEGRRAIRVNGAPLQLPKGAYSYKTSDIRLGLKLKPRTKYTVTLVGPLKDEFGQPLQDRAPLSFVTGDYQPLVSLPVPSGVLEASAPRNLPLYFRNVERSELWSKQLDPAELVALLANPSFGDKPTLVQIPGSVHQKLAVAGAPNSVITRRVNLAGLIGNRRTGLLALEMQSWVNGAKPDEVRLEHRLVRITDLAVTAKYSPHSSLVWVTSLAGGRPVPGCQVSIWRPGSRAPLWSGTTDAAGLAVGPGASQLGAEKESHRFVFFAEKGGDASFVESDTQSGIRVWDYGLEETWEDREGSLIGMLFSDRGVYRPGETVRVKGLVRRAGERALLTPQGEAVKLVVNDSRGEKLATVERRLSEFGSFSFDVSLPAGAALGSYGVTGKLDRGGALYGSFSVEEYRPAEFSVTVEPKQRSAVRGDRLSWTGSGQYLFGSPMRQAEARWTLSHDSASFSPPGHEGFVFSDEVPWWSDGGEGEAPSSSGTVAQGRARLDAEGGIAGALELKPPQMTGPQSYELELTVTDISRQSISSGASVLLHPGEFYLGAKPKETFVTGGQSVETEVLAVSPEGKKQAGVRVEGTLYSRVWTSVRKQGMNGAHTFVTRPVETAVGTCSVVTAEKPQRCEIAVSKAGYYVLRLRARDKRQNPLLTSFGVYVAGPDYVPWRRDNESRVELVTDRKSYRLGQTARILVKSPFASAHGLLTVERNGIYTRKPLKLDRTAAWLEVPITEELLPTAYVSVMLVRGRVGPATPRRTQQAEPGAAEDEDPGRPVFKMGYAKLSISQAKRALRVSVRPARGEYRPGEEVTVDLGVLDSSGKGLASELTVIAADEGVLSLIGYRTPDPMAIFYAERGLSVRTADNHMEIINPRVFGEKGKNPGGGGAGEGGGGQGTRRSFISTPYYNPSVITDASGRAQVRFKLPDNLTTFRIMAVAASRASEFGSGQGSIKVNKPLLLLPALPRLVRVGDRVEAGVVVHNRSNSGGEARIETAVQGLQLEGDRVRTVHLAAGGSAEARFAYVALSPGEATVRFSARLGDHSDALELKRPVKLPLVIESVAAYGSTETGVSEAVAPAGGLRSDVGGLEVTLSSSALVGLKPAMEYLLEYPYECLEQTTSRLVPLVLLRDLRQAFALKIDGDADRLIGQLISKVEQMQRWDGGFTYWPSDYESYPWVSAYAAWGLSRAKASGFRVSQRVLDQAKSYLKASLRRAPQKGMERIGRDVQTYLVHALTELGERPSAYFSSLFEKRAELATFSKALLLSSMVRAKADAGMISTLTRELGSQVHQTGQTARVEENLGDGYAPLFHSDDRSTALTLIALLQAQPEHPLVEKMVRHLLDARRNGRWRNTQETVFALLGLHTYFNVREKAVPSFVARVLLGEMELLQHSFQGRSLTVLEKSIPMKDLAGRPATLGFVKEGSGRLYYGARLRYARASLPREPWDEGFVVTRTYQRINEGHLSPADGETPGVSVERVRAGDLVRVRLDIVAPQAMHFVAVDDPLPAGLEALNFRLMTSERSLRRESVSFRFRPAHGRSGYSSAWATPFTYQQVRDDRMQLFANELPPGSHTYVYLARATTIGKFVAPPTQVEQMYAPEVFGRSSAGSFEVTAK